MAMFNSYVKLPEGKPPFSYGFPMVFPLKPRFFLWFSYGFPIKTFIFLWFSYGFPMVFLWISEFGDFFSWFPMVRPRRLELDLGHQRERASREAGKQPTELAGGGRCGWNMLIIFLEMGLFKMYIYIYRNRISPYIFRMLILYMSIEMGFVGFVGIIDGITNGIIRDIYIYIYSMIIA